ncbi:bifunctional glycosyltransferase [Nannochloropsis oceanica]
MSSPPLHLVVFSKDRAFQCTALLLSLDLYMSPAPTSLTVIYKASSPFFLEGYHELEEARRVGSRNNDCKSERNEGREIGRALEGGNKLTTSAAPSPVCLPASEGREGRKEREGGGQEEEVGERVWAIHTKLHPGISYSHTLDKALHAPPLLFHRTLGTAGFLFERDETKNDDWHYPWDLCGSIYRLQDARAVIEELIPLHHDGTLASGPNQLEVWGNDALHKQAAAAAVDHHHYLLHRECKICTRHLSTSLHPSPYPRTPALKPWRHGGGRAPPSPSFPTPSAPGATPASTSAISSSPLPPPPLPPSLVSVLLPVHNGDGALGKALRSVMREEDCEEYRLEILVIDDASTDQSSEVVRHGQSESTIKRREQEAAADAAAHRAMGRLLGKDVPLSAVTALRRPDAVATSLSLLTQAVDLLLLLLPSFLRSLSFSSPTETVVRREEEGGEEEEKRVGCLQVESDVQGRLRAIAALGIGHMGLAAMPLLQRVQEATRRRGKEEEKRGGNGL